MAWLERGWWVLALLALIWGVQILNLLTGYLLNNWFGLIPRSLGGLDGILFMPLLHGSLAHAAANTPPLAILGGLVALTVPRIAGLATALIVVLGGLGVWIIASTAIHVGASGLIFGWFGFLLARGVVERQMLSLAVATMVALVYGTMIWGVLPGETGVSWESHLMGALAGIAAAVLLRSRSRT